MVPTAAYSYTRFSTESRRPFNILKMDLAIAIAVVLNLFRATEKVKKIEVEQTAVRRDGYVWKKKAAPKSDIVRILFTRNTDESVLFFPILEQSWLEDAVYRSSLECMVVFFDGYERCQGDNAAAIGYCACNPVHLHDVQISFLCNPQWLCQRYGGLDGSRRTLCNSNQCFCAVNFYGRTRFWF